MIDNSPFSEEWVLQKMIEDYKKYGRIIVAYDFDSTVHTCDKNAEEACKIVRALLRICSKYTDDIDMICFTCRGDRDVKSLVIPYLDEEGIRHDKINENSDNVSKKVRKTLSCKIMYTVFLDDKAGLREATSILRKFITWLMNEKIVQC